MNAEKIVENGDTMTMQEKVDFLKELISVQGNIDILCFDREGHSLGVTDRRTNDLADIFRASGCEDEMYEHSRHSAMPISLGTSFGLLWNAVYDMDGDCLHTVYVMGPIFISENTQKEFADKVEQSPMPIDIKIKLLRLYADIPQIPQARHSYNVMMLHYCVTGQRVSLNDIVSSSVGAFTDVHREELDLLGYQVLTSERKLLANVTDGNPNYYEDYEKASNLQLNAFHVHDPVRYAQDYGIIFTALCADAAIKGGMYPSLAFTARGNYVGKIENSRTVPAVAVVIEEMYGWFIREVQYGKKAGQYSSPVQKCCDYIQVNLKRKLPVSELASLTGYSPEHISRLFSKEVGTSIKRYIDNAKLEALASDLTYTDLSVRELAAKYGYCSVSHMAKSFCRRFSMTPTAYREKRSEA